MGGLQSPVQVGGAGFNSESSSKKSGSSRRRSSSEKNATTPRRWTKQEDEKLRSAVAAVGPQNWKTIAQDFMGNQRSDVQCLHRWQKVLQPGLVKGPWTKEEDQLIMDCIDAGITKWNEIAKRISGRIGNQCRERWCNHLDPSLKKRGWTEEEDAILLKLQAKWGNSWTKIANILPDRSENAVKNRWNSAVLRPFHSPKSKDRTEGIGATRNLENFSNATFLDGLGTATTVSPGIAPGIAPSTATTVSPCIAPGIAPIIASAREVAVASTLITEDNDKIEPKRCHRLLVDEEGMPFIVEDDNSNDNVPTQGNDPKDVESSGEVEEEEEEEGHKGIISEADIANYSNEQLAKLATDWRTKSCVMKIRNKQWGQLKKDL
ncbi:hypothetical protein TrVE_jg12365 [Triparma verrucosa]|uniref:Uncharacterized protein n=1 Tax=Triparma verrucosa TaxID=1606542 RepID=A0A9W7KRE2_9STRA|nr:hypothetical protein TrVE_jg12365 [Triparma verrucosa]